VNLGAGLINEILGMGGKDVWLIMRPNALGVTYQRDGEDIRHVVALPFGRATEGTLAALLEMADEEFNG
jgi:hypothetical protein